MQSQGYLLKCDQSYIINELKTSTFIIFFSQPFASASNPNRFDRSPNFSISQHAIETLVTQIALIKIINYVRKLL